MNIYGVEFITPEEDMVCKSYIEHGVFEPLSLEYWKETCLANPNSTVLDIGAYTGLYAIMAAQLGVKANAYEPNHIVFERLFANIKRNNVTHLIDAYNNAVGDHHGQVDFYIKTGTKLTSASTLIQTEGYAKVQQTMMEVKISTPVSAIKIDVEGAEEFIVKSIHDVIANNKPLLIVEVLDDEHEKQVTDIMCDTHGYPKPIMVDERNLIFRFPR